MAVDVYILSIEDFKDRADITENIQTQKLKTWLGVVQEKYAIKILCDAFYNEILDQIEADSLTTSNTALLPFLKDYLIFKVYKRYILGAGVLTTTAGLRVQSDDTTEQISDVRMGELIGQANGDANYYQDTLVNFLTCNKNDYPVWRDSQCGCGKKRTFKVNNFSKIGGSKGKVRIKWT